MLRNLAMHVADQAHRQALCQLAAFRLAQQASCQAAAQRVQLDFRDRSLQPQEKPPVRGARIVHAVPIADEASPVATQIQQWDRGRDAHYWAPPAQIRTGPIRASGSHLGCLTAKRWFGQGWRMRGLGSQSLAILAIRSQVMPFLWPRRSRERRQRWRTWTRKALRAGRLVGTAW